MPIKRPGAFPKRCGQTFVDESHLSRELLRCKDCGQLYFFEFYEEIDWEDGNDPQFSTYVPVETGAEIEMLKKASPIKLLEYLPQLRRDFPKDAKSPTAVSIQLNKLSVVEVRNGSGTDFRRCPHHVRLAPESGPMTDMVGCQFRAAHCP